MTVDEKTRHRIAELLSEFGLSEREVAVYVALLERGSATAQQLAEITEIPPTKIYDVLNQLVERWLCRKVVAKDEVYIAIPPAEAGKSFLEQLKGGSDSEVNSLIYYGEEVKRELAEFARKGSTTFLIPPSERIKVLRRKNEIIHMLRSLNYTAQKVLRAVIRPPFVVGVGESEKTDGSEPYLRGVKFVIVVDHHICEDADMALFAREASGDSSQRTAVYYYPHMRLSMVISDEKEAGVSLFKPYGRVELWVRDDAVVRALALSFDKLCEKSIPLSPQKVDEICLGQNSKD